MVPVETRLSISRPISIFGIPRNVVAALILPALLGSFADSFVGENWPIDIAQVGVGVSLALSVVALFVFRRNPDFWTIWTARLRLAPAWETKVRFDAG